MDFEKKLKALEEAAEKLDNKELALDEAIGIYENGVKLVRECLDNLNESKGKIEVIRGELDTVLKQNGGEIN